MRDDAAHIWRERFEFRRHPHPRAAERDPRAKLAEQINIRTRHAAVQNIAQNRDVPAFELPFAIANRERVEQSLRRMFMRAVARIHHRNFQALGHEFRSARRGVSDHDSIGTHRFERANGVNQRFALLAGSRTRLAKPSCPHQGATRRW